MTRTPALLAGAVLTMLLVVSCAGSSPQTWPQGSTHGAWRSVFTGYGSTGQQPDGTLVLSPTPPTGSDTHAALIAGVTPYRDFDVRIRLRTTAQLRRPVPNPWERGWVLWHYTDPSHFYYLLLKTDGWEIGKEDPAYPGSQRFLATGPGSYPLGQWHEVRIRQTADTMAVWIDGAALATARDDANPHQEGLIGLYTEDATAEYQNVTINPP
jgi:hypothetical protein